MSLFPKFNFKNSSHLKKETNNNGINYGEKAMPFKIPTLSSGGDYSLNRKLSSENTFKNNVFTDSSMRIQMLKVKASNNELKLGTKSFKNVTTTYKEPRQRLRFLRYKR